MSPVRPNQNADSWLSTRPLSGMPEPEHVIERRDAIGGDQDQRVAGGVDVADLAAADQGQAVELRI